MMIFLNESIGILMMSFWTNEISNLPGVLQDSLHISQYLSHQ